MSKEERLPQTAAKRDDSESDQIQHTSMKSQVSKENEGEGEMPSNKKYDYLSEEVKPLVYGQKYDKRYRI